MPLSDIANVEPDAVAVMLAISAELRCTPVRKDILWSFIERSKEKYIEKKYLINFLAQMGCFQIKASRECLLCIDSRSSKTACVNDSGEDACSIASSDASGGDGSLRSGGAALASAFSGASGGDGSLPSGGAAFFGLTVDETREVTLRCSRGGLPPNTEPHHPALFTECELFNSLTIRLSREFRLARFSDRGFECLLKKQ
jgi:hypothetical protein